MTFSIKIAERLLPFSHLPGAKVPVPCASLAVEVFPTLLRVYDLSSSYEPVQEVKFDFTGPVVDFTAQLDLEKGRIVVWGKAKEGYFQYSLSCSPGSELILQMHRAPEDGVGISIHNEPIKLFKGSKKSLHSKVRSKTQDRNWERLSLGNHKKQDWPLVMSRCDPVEILPVWYALGQQTVASAGAMPATGNGILLEKCARAAASLSPEHVLEPFLNLFRASFSGVMCPHPYDLYFQGIAPCQSPNEWFCPLILLSEGAKLLRGLFLEQRGNVLSVLPKLPPDLHCGRMAGICLQGIGEADMEWSKKQIRRLIVKAKYDTALALDLRGHVKTFRVRKNRREKGLVLDSGSEVYLQAGVLYQIDQFEY